MSGCHDCRELLLDHLYDLLEEADQRALLDHLGGCPACQAALEAARAQQQMLAQAARLHFPQVTFTPPAVEPPVSPPVVLSLPPRRRPWRRWAAAAAVLVAAAGLALPAQRAGRDYLAAREAVRQHDAALAAARTEVAAAHAALEGAARERDRKIEEIHQAIRSRELRLVVSGPRNVQPGAPAEFQVRTTDLDGRPAEAEVRVRLGERTTEGLEQADLAKKKDRTTSKLAATHPAFAPGGVAGKTATVRREAELEVATLGKGHYRVRIPPTVPLPPGRSLGMFVAARKKGARSSRRANR